MAAIASFHLTTWRGTGAAWAHLGRDRRALARVPGLELVRLLGTGRGSSTRRGATPARTAAFLLWRDEGDLEEFLAGHRVAARWRDATEHWSVRLRGAGGHGAWRGVDVPGRLARGSDAGRIAMVTRADVRAAAWRRFARAGGPVDDELSAAPGLLAVVAIGEAPVARLGTFSLWESLAAMRAFADSARHAAVVTRTRRERWYGEEMFARFEPYGSTGAWDGRDPLA